MTTLKTLIQAYGSTDCRDLGSRKLEQLRNGLKTVVPGEILSADDGRGYIELLRKFREAVAENDKLHGENYLQLLNSLLSVGEDGLYSDPLRFIFELIQNVDDCEYRDTDDCRLDMRFDFNCGKIVLTYNETGFTPFNVFAVTGIGERAKNLSASKNEIGEKGIGFKSVFGVAERVLIRSGWFSFSLHKDNFTIPVAEYTGDSRCEGTELTLYAPGKVKEVYNQIKEQYCHKDALFSRNPLLFLNKLTSLRMYYDSWRSMEFHVSRGPAKGEDTIQVERDIEISVSLHDHDLERGSDVNVREKILCTRYTYPVLFSPEACRARYGEKTEVGNNTGKTMLLQVVMPYVKHLENIGTGTLYSFLPTQLKLTVPVVCHAPFKLDASREFVDPQGKNQWFRESVDHLSALMDYAYMDWSQTAKESIVWYLPGESESLFAPNNGKEKCLSEQERFRGAHFLQMPLFLAADHTFQRAQDIFCFAQEEKNVDPEQVCRLMGFTKALFIPPASFPYSKFGIHTERNIAVRLFQAALKREAITAGALEYLDSAGFEYNEKCIPEEAFDLTLGQIEAIMGHDRLAKLFREDACRCIRQNRRPNFSVTGAQFQRITDVLYDGFGLSETPNRVERYFKYNGGACVRADSGEQKYLPCHNAVILFGGDMLSSFAAFCSDIDPTDPFAIRVKLREASERLDRCVEDNIGSAADYLRDLQNIRLIIKESLGRGYGSYIKPILEAGTDQGRFVQELLQNADDCQYPNDTEYPEFRLTLRGSSVVAEYNETGFTRSDIRAITAIGESTKNKILGGSAGTIGEKGVGFKMVFGIASEVRIFSNEYRFSLTDREPTIPKWIDQPSAPVLGTRMELMLKDQVSFPAFNEKMILELCLCLRRLKKLKFGAHEVFISDTGDRRIITIDKRRHIFKKFVYSFIVENEAALNERRSGIREVSLEQRVVCYVPEKSRTAGYCLYAGLPTKHQINIPLVIDAPFLLTTSREQIKSEFSPWNDIVRREVYAAVRGVMDALKLEERSSVFRFVRFMLQLHGSSRVYINGLSDCPYLNAYPFLDELRSCEILPTFDPKVFAKPIDGTARRYSDATNILFRLLPPSDFGGVDPSTAIDVPDKDYESVLNALGCVPAGFGVEFELLSNHIESFITNKEFRPKLYEFLLNRPEVYCERLRKYAIIPVFDKISDSVKYVPWEDDSIFVKSGASVSGNDYYILSEQLLPKSDCEKIFGVNINEMNEEWERARYNKRLRQIIRGSNIDVIYEYLMKEYRAGALASNGSLGTLLELKELIPLKNQLGEIVDTQLFRCNQPVGYFSVEMLQKITVHKDCEGFAAFLKCGCLSEIYYRDICYSKPLTEDDVEALQDEYFINSEEILRHFYWDGYLSEDLLSLCGLDYLAMEQVSADSTIYDFPEELVGDPDQLRAHVGKLWENPGKLVSVKVERMEKKVQNNGGTFDLDVMKKDARRVVMDVYAPEGAPRLCFCQMCRRTRPQLLIEVNSLEYEPEYFLPRLRISLCLDCSKLFKSFRDDDKIREGYMRAIKSADIPQGQGTVRVPVHGEYTVTFTAKHLAEIQETLRQIPDRHMAGIK